MEVIKPTSISSITINFNLMKNKIQFYLFRKRFWNLVPLLAILALTLLAQPGFASVTIQNTRVKIAEKNISLADLIWKIDSQTEYEFVYTSEELEGYHFSSINEEGELNDILDEIFEGKNLSYSLQEGVYIIKKVAPKPVKKEQTQKKKIKGKVTDDQGIPLPGVSVVIKGTNVGVATDIDGLYSLEMEERKAVLIFSFVGMISKEIAYTGQDVLNVTLASDSEQMEEVVITGYQTIKKGRATGSFQILKQEDFDKVSSLDLKSKLQDVVAGVSTTGNGKLLVRGKATLMADSEPLIVVDGMPWEGNLQDINSDDVEQITVLKDAASTSIYGVRGANGVIVITTKKGKRDSKLRINYKNQFTVNSKFDVKDLDHLSSDKHVDLEWDYYNNNESEPWYANVSEVAEIYRDLNNGLSEEEARKQLDYFKNVNNASEISDLFYRRATTQKHTLSFNYGDAKNQFYASISFDESKHSAKRDGNKNISFNLNDNFKLNDVIGLKLNVFGNKRTTENNSMAMSGIKPYLAIRDENGNANAHAAGFLIKSERELYEAQSDFSLQYRPLDELKLNDNTTEENNITTNVTIDITPFKGVKLSGSIGYRLSKSNTERMYDKKSFYVRDLVNEWTTLEQPMFPWLPETKKQYVPYGNILKYSNGTSKNLTYRTQLNINKQYKDFSFNFDAGFERNSFQSEGNNNNARYNYNPQTLTESDLDFDEMRSFGAITNWMGNRPYWMEPRPRRMESENRYQSIYAIGNVNYQNKYSLFGSWRLDKTNLYGRSSKYRDQPAWSIGTKWQISEEKFFQSNVIDQLGLKVSYGLAGNVEKSTSPQLILATYSHWLTQKTVGVIASPENPDLSWEKTYTTNIGVDFALLRNRISGVIEYYNRRTNDILSPVKVDPTSGFNRSVYYNNGSIVNRGVDLNLNASVISTKDFSYNVSLNFSYNYNKVKKADIQAKTASDYLFNRNTAVGQPTDYISVVRNAGLDEPGEPLVYNGDGERVHHDAISTEFTKEDLKFLGRRSAPYFGSFTNLFRWKNLTASIYCSYNFGHYRMKLTKQNGVAGIERGALHKSIDSRWKQAGDEKHAHIARLMYSGESANRVSAVWDSDWNYEKADYIRLKSINLTYNLSSVVKKMGVESLSVKAGIENVAFWSRTESGKAPDAGNDKAAPLPKIFTFGLSLGL
jgi:TonB-linked SusC/RagA family outer membrane protein